jgi:leader peptidase (prepilin peptidase)/N-methyltransferase
LIQFLIFFATIFGLLIGSFLNALIYRLPRGISIAFPRSSCPHCQHVIAWYENIPVISFLFLRGKCSNCSAKISWQYPAVELLTALFAFFIAPTNIDGTSLFNFFFFFSVFCAFLVHFIVDLKHQILPDSVTIYLGLMFFVIGLIIRPWTFLAIGGAIGLGFPLLVSWIFYLLRGQVGLGGGDIKLFAVLGLYLGPMGIIQNIFLSCLFGAVVGVVLIASKAIKKENPIPFGPFILIVASFQIFAEKWFSDLLTYIP